MRFKTPLYYDKFRCSADKCSDNCCIGWEIDIDEKTALLYSETDGIFGQKLKENITAETPKSFILKGERCPFLNDRNLCEIIINMGENSLCQICSDHPRYFEWYGEIKEGGIGLCCEEGAKLILLSDEPLSFNERELSCDESEEIDGELFSLLSLGRNEIFSCLTDKKLSFCDKVSAVMRYAEKVQFSVDNYADTLPGISFENEKEKNEGDIKSILESFTCLEPIDENWTSYLKTLTENAEEIEKETGLLEKYKINLLIYFIYRYFLKGVFDGEILSKVKFAFISTAIIDLIYKQRKLGGFSDEVENAVRASVLYSKQAEYSSENLDLICEMTYEKECYSSENIIGLFSKN